MRDAAGVPILTDIHEPSHAARRRRGGRRPADPRVPRRARPTCIVAAARTGRVVNIKKGQFLAPADMRHAIEKVTSAGNTGVIVTERGFSFGYNNLVVDMRAFPMLRALGYPVVYDVTHSLQLPGGGDGVTAGQAEFIEPMASAGVAAGVDGVFLEVHERPEHGEERRAERAAAGSARAAAAAAGADPRHRPRAIAAARWGPDSMTDERPPTALDLARKVLRTEAAAILGLVDRIDGGLRARRPAALRVPRPRHRHRHGQVGHHLPEDRRDAVEHRHLRVVPAPGRSDPRRSRRDP